LIKVKNVRNECSRHREQLNKDKEMREGGAEVVKILQVVQLWFGGKWRPTQLEK
jgi:hypothetical protein